MLYVSRDTSEWYTNKFLSIKTVIGLLLYYFAFYIYMAPNISYRLLLIFLDSSTVFQYAQFISDMLCMIPIIYFLIPVLKDSWYHFSEYPSKILWKGISLYIPQLLTNAILQTIIVALVGVNNGANQETAMFLFKSAPWTIAIPAICIAPFIEEGIFRGIIFRELRRYGFWPAALASGFSFGLLHCVGDILSANWAGALYIFVYATMGIFMCKAYENSKNIFGAISLHMFSNIIAVLSMTFLL